MNQVSANGYTRISRKEAKKMFNTGKEVYMAPCKVIPHYPMMKLHRTCSDIKYAEQEFNSCIDKTTKQYCNSESGKEIYFYKLSGTAVKYKLSADFGSNVRLINVNTGQVVDVEKSKVIERIQLGLVEILGYSISPDNKDLVAYR